MTLLRLVSHFSPKEPGAASWRVTAIVTSQGSTKQLRCQGLGDARAREETGTENKGAVVVLLQETSLDSCFGHSLGLVQWLRGVEFLEVRRGRETPEGDALGVGGEDHRLLSRAVI